MSDEGFPVGQSAIPNQYRPENLPCHGKYLYIDWHNREISPHLEPRYICAPLTELGGFSWPISCDLQSCPVTQYFTKTGISKNGYAGNRISRGELQLRSSYTSHNNYRGVV